MASKFNDWAMHIAKELEKSKQKLYEREDRTIQRSDIKFAEVGQTKLCDQGQSQISDSFSGGKASREE